MCIARPAEGSELMSCQELKPEANGAEAHSPPKMPVSFASVATGGSDVSVAA
jgi:hypothetical protein